MKRGPGDSAVMALGPAAAVMLCLAGTAWAGPRLEVRPDRINFGTMKQDEVRRTTVRLSNTGDAALVIEEIRPSCAECIVDRIGVTSLAPGASVDLPVTYRAAQVPGRQTAFIMLHTNDPNDPLKRIDLEANVVPKGETPRLEVEPGTLDLGLVLVGAPLTRTVVLRNGGEADVVFQDFTTSPDVSLERRPAERLGAGKKDSLTLTIAPTAAGVLRGHVTLVTNDPERGTVTIPMSGYAATPEQAARLARGVTITLQWTEDNPAALESLRVSNRERVPVRVIHGVAADRAGVAVGPGEFVRVAVPRGAAGGTSGTTAVEIVFPNRTAVPGQPEGSRE